MTPMSSDGANGAAPAAAQDHTATLMGAMRAVLALIDDVDALRAENRQLKDALEARTLIERAKGMLMARRGCDEATAFQLLVVLARKEQRKVRAVAADFATDAGAHPLM